MTPLPIILMQYFSLGTVLIKSFREALSSNSRLDVREVKTELKSVIEIFWDDVFIVRNKVKKENLDV